MSQSTDFFLVILPGIALKMNNTCALTALTLKNWHGDWKIQKICWLKSNEVTMQPNHTGIEVLLTKLWQNSQVQQLMLLLILKKRSQPRSNFCTRKSFIPCIYISDSYKTFQSLLNLIGWYFCSSSSDCIFWLNLMSPWAQREK